MPPEEDPWSDTDNQADFVDPFAQPSQGGGDLGRGGLDAGRPQGENARLGSFPKAFPHLNSVVSTLFPSLRPSSRPYHRRRRFAWPPRASGHQLRHRLRPGRGKASPFAF